MPQQLFNIRKRLTQVSGQLKQQNFLSAVQSTHTALKTLMSGSGLMKAESDELKNMLADACAYLGNNNELRKIFPLAIEYKEGREEELLGTLTELMDIIQTEAAKAATALALEVQQKKEAALQKGQDELDSGKHDDARKTFFDLTAEFSEDADLNSDVGERFMRSGLYEDASHYLQASASINGSAHIFNRLGIALRKMKRFDVAEENFQKALGLEKHDPNLYFNLGRLYLDWKKWPETIENADAALALDNNFTEARQLSNYAKRMLAQTK